MPYTVERIAAGIQLMTWTDHMTEDEFRQSVFDRVQLANEYNDHRYVAIMDLQNVAVRSTNIRLATWAVRFDMRLRHVIVVRPNTSVGMIVNLVAKMMSLPYTTCDSVDDAIAIAQKILANPAHK